MILGHEIDNLIYSMPYSLDDHCRILIIQPVRGGEYATSIYMANIDLNSSITFPLINGKLLVPEEKCGNSHLNEFLNITFHPNIKIQLKMSGKSLNLHCNQIDSKLELEYLMRKFSLEIS